MIFTDLPLHIFIVHAPESVLILLQITVHRPPALADDVTNEAHIIGPVQKNFVAGLRQHIDRARDKSVHAVFISDIFSGETCHMVPLLLPPDDGIVVYILRLKIPEQRMLCSSDDGFRDCRTGLEVHIRHPHWNKIKSIHRRTGFKAPDALSGSIYSCCILTPSVNN